MSRESIITCHWYQKLTQEQYWIFVAVHRFSIRKMWSMGKFTGFFSATSNFLVLDLALGKNKTCWNKTCWNTRLDPIINQQFLNIQRQPYWQHSKQNEETMWHAKDIYNEKIRITLKSSFDRNLISHVLNEIKSNGCASLYVRRTSRHVTPGYQNIKCGLHRWVKTLLNEVAPRMTLNENFLMPVTH